MSAHAETDPSLREADTGTTIESLTQAGGEAADLLEATERAGLLQRVRGAQIHMLYRNLGTAFGGQLLGALLVAWTMKDTFPALHVWLWVFASIGNQLARLWLLRAYNRASPGPDQADYWGRMWLIGAVISGLLWGSTMLLFVSPEALREQVVLLSLLLATCGVAVALSSMHLPSFYAFVLATLVPVILRHMWEGDSYGYLIAFIAFIMLIAMLRVGKNFNALIARALLNRYANEVLARRLREHNEALHQAREAAVQANRAKSQFFAAASHDLRQPLHAMGLFAAALSSKVRDPEVSNLVCSISSSVEALEGLFNELLDLSKMDAGKVRAELSDVSVATLFDRLRMDFEPEAFDKGLQLRMRHPGLYVRTDAFLLERILRNLVANAIRYTERGGVLVAARAHRRCIRFEVWDTGIGIAEPDQARIFEEFVQLDNPERNRRKGLGLGLSIVQRLAHLLDHPLHMASRPGRGTVFRLDVPLGRAPTQRRQAALRPQGPADLGGRLILVIDDESSIVDGMQALLTGWGAQVLCAGSGEEALALMQSADAPPDLIIADYQLRAGEVGPDVVASLRQHANQDIPAIMVTGSATPERMEAARDLGHHLLLKPVMPAKLRSLINFKLQQQPTGT